MEIDIWKYIDKNTLEPCWIWSNTDIDGYGIYIEIQNNEEWIWFAHRIVFYQLVDKDIKEFDIIHKCKNKSCVNPDHLMKESKGSYKERTYWNKVHNRVRLLNKKNIKYLRDNKEEYINNEVKISDLAKSWNVNPKTIIGVLENRTYLNIKT